MEELKGYLEFNKKIIIEKLSSTEVKRYKTALYKETQNEFCFYKPKETPAKDANYVEFNNNETVRILIYTLDGIYSFKSKIVKNGTKLLKIEKPVSYKKIQRRALLRQPLPVKVKIEYIENNETIVDNVNIVDVSGGGISFNTDRELFNQKRLIVRFSVDDKEINSFGEIIEIRKNRKTEKGKYRLSIRFLSLNNKDRETIIKHCLIYQIKTRVKNRLINS